MVAFSALGIAQAAYDAAVKYAGERVQFGRPIGGFQLVQQMIADMMTLVETSRLLCYRAADALDRDAADSQLLCSMAKRHATDAVLRVAETAMQVHGGAGYTTLFPVERHYRDARHLSIAEGTSQISPADGARRPGPVRAEMIASAGLPAGSNTHRPAPCLKSFRPPNASCKSSKSMPANAAR